VAFVTVHRLGDFLSSLLLLSSSFKQFDFCKYVFIYVFIGYIISVIFSSFCCWLVLVIKTDLNLSITFCHIVHVTVKYSVVTALSFH